MKTFDIKAHFQLINLQICKHRLQMSDNADGLFMLLNVFNLGDSLKC